MGYEAGGGTREGRERHGSPFALALSRVRARDTSEAAADLCLRWDPVEVDEGGKGQPPLPPFPWSILGLWVIDDVLKRYAPAAHRCCCHCHCLMSTFQVAIKAESAGGGGGGTGGRLLGSGTRPPPPPPCPLGPLSCQGSTATGHAKGTAVQTVSHGFRAEMLSAQHITTHFVPQEMTFEGGKRPTFLPTIRFCMFLKNVARPVNFTSGAC